MVAKGACWGEGVLAHGVEGSAACVVGVQEGDVGVGLCQALHQAGHQKGVGCFLEDCLEEKQGVPLELHLQVHLEVQLGVHHEEYPEVHPQVLLEEQLEVHPQEHLPGYLDVDTEYNILFI